MLVSSTTSVAMLAETFVRLSSVWTTEDSVSPNRQVFSTMLGTMRVVNKPGVMCVDVYIFHAGSGKAACGSKELFSFWD